MIPTFSTATLRIIRTPWLPRFGREAEADNGKWTASRAKFFVSCSSSNISAAGPERLVEELLFLFLIWLVQKTVDERKGGLLVVSAPKVSPRITESEYILDRGLAKSHGDDDRRFGSTLPSNY